MRTVPQVIGGVALRFRRPLAIDSNGIDSVHIVHVAIPIVIDSIGGYFARIDPHVGR